MTQAPAQPASRTAAAAVDRKQIERIVIKCAGLTKIFRDFWLRNRVKAVDGIDFEVYRGEVFGLLGPNGSGKSTTTKMILGLLHATAGRIAVFGHHPREVAIKEHIGYLPEESYLYRFLNARETLEYYGRLFHQKRRQRLQRIDMLLDMVGLDKVAHRPVGEYSKGMQRRIGLAQALINDPQLLILDEPTTGLDPIGTRQIKDLILELRDRGKTVLLCSHLLADVEDVCNRVAIMYGGKIRQYGTVDELLVQSGMTDIQAANLTPDDIQAVEDLLESRGKHIERVEQPRERLETLFLNIVQTAQTEGLATSGAGSGGPLAEFLTGGDGPSADPDQLIEQLVSGPRSAAGGGAGADGRTRDGDGVGVDTHPAPEQAQALPGEAEVIEQLVGHTPEPVSEPDAAAPPRQRPGAAPSSASGAEPEPTSEDDVDDSVLNSLLGGDEKQRDEEPRPRDK